MNFGNLQAICDLVGYEWITDDMELAPATRENPDPFRVPVMSAGGSIATARYWDWIVETLRPDRFRVLSPSEFLDGMIEDCRDDIS